MLLHERNIYFRVLPEIKTNIGKLLDKKHTLQWGCLEDGFLISNHMESIMSLLQVSLLPALHESALTVRNLCAFVPERTAFREAINNAAVLKRCFQVWEFGFGIGTKGGGAGHSSEVWGERGRWRRRGRDVAKFVGLFRLWAEGNPSFRSFFSTGADSRSDRRSANHQRGHRDRSRKGACCSLFYVLIVPCVACLEVITKNFGS